MAKRKTLKKQEKLPPGFSEWKFDEKLFLDRKQIAETLVDCLLEGDIDSFQDVLYAHIHTLSKAGLARETGLSRKTIHELIRSEKFDPKLSTLASLLRMKKAS